MRRIVTAALAYAALVFAAGFLLGSLRFLFVAPAIGAVAAVLVELPFMLAISWLACRRVTARLRVGNGCGTRLVLGGLAFLFLMVAEAALGQVLGTPLAAQIAAFKTLAGALGLAGQVAFALIPVVQRGSRPAGGDGNFT